MKKLTGIKTSTYDAGDGFRIDIVDDDAFGVYYAFIYRERYTIREDVASVIKEYSDMKSFKASVEEKLDEYKALYDEHIAEFFDDEDEDDIDFDDECDCDCENCPYHDEDCDEADSCENEDDKCITLPVLIGNDKEVEIAKEIRLGFIRFINEKFVTRHQQSIIAFVRWYVNAYDMAAYWIAYKDSMTDMFFVVDRITEWRNSVC